VDSTKNRREFMSEDSRIGFLLSEEKTKKILAISKSFKKAPEQFINDIIDSTYNKIQMIEINWDYDD
jgi:hypothetical protein